MRNISTLFTPTTKEEITMRVHKSPSLSPVFLRIFIIAICMFGASAANVQAATFTVMNTNDSGPGSLRQAIADANAAAGADTIDFDTAGVFATPQTITLTTGELVIYSDLAISGTGAANLTISGNHISRVFQVLVVTVRLDALTVTGGNSVFGGGGILNFGTLTVMNSTISDNNRGLRRRWQFTTTAAC